MGIKDKLEELKMGSVVLGIAGIVSGVISLATKNAQGLRLSMTCLLPYFAIQSGTGKTFGEKLWNAGGFAVTVLAIAIWSC